MLICLDTNDLRWSHGHFLVGALAVLVLNSYAFEFII